ncbi:alpha motif domain-containing protein Samd12 [Acrasis kona]|uniref:Alpha motif domain-containing protein Samd12 n=1 Tax=Acrasis kona TaxID=1008807 RepID=A0AAW2Z6K9_9EUKA
MGASLSNDAEIEICQKEVIKWTKDDVSAWLVDNDFGIYKTQFYENDIDGEALLNLDDDKLTKLGVNVGNSIKILSRVKVITEDATEQKETTTPNKRQTPPVSTNPPVLTQKEEERLIALCLKKLEKLKGLQKLDVDQRKDKARSLVIKKALLESYLNSSYVATRKTMLNLLESSDSHNHSSGVISMAQSGSGPVENQSEDDEDKEQIRQVLEKIDSLEGTTAASQLNQNKSQQQKLTEHNKSMYDIDHAPVTTKNTQITDEEFLKIKLVIVEIHNSSSQRTFRRVLSLWTFPLCTHRGSVVILEWNDSCLVVPRKCYSGAAVLAADVNQFFKGPQVPEALDKISEVICEWNAHYQYSQKTYNCQLFVDKICEALDIKLKFTGALESFLQQLRRTGQCEMSYAIPEKLQADFQSPTNSLQFQTHQELDQFVNSVIEKHPTYFDMGEHKDDFTLLKSYDRAFWLRHFKNRKQEEYKPHKCPFNNPTASGSIIDNFFTYGKNKKKNKM